MNEYEILGRIISEFGPDGVEIHGPADILQLIKFVFEIGHEVGYDKGYGEGIEFARDMLK